MFPGLVQGLRLNDFAWRACLSAAEIVTLAALAANHSCDDGVCIFRLWLKRNFLLCCWLTLFGFLGERGARSDREMSRHEARSEAIRNHLQYRAVSATLSDAYGTCPQHLVGCLVGTTVCRGPMVRNEVHGAHLQV